MSTLAGWFGNHLTDGAALGRMAEVMSGPEPLVESHQSQGFAVTTVRPAIARGGSYLAATPDQSLVVAFCGYLHSEDPQIQRNPAPWCLELYQKLGTSFACELNGSFAVAIIDRPAGELLLVTDRIGTRALYYSLQQDFVFGSEVKAVLQYPGISRKLNHERLREFLVIACVPGWVTYYDHVCQVPSASVLVWDGQKTKITRYWEPRFERAAGADLQELATEAVEAVRASVRRSCIAGERPGLMLSGGLDSRTIAATSQRSLLCVTMQRQECYEVETARRVAGALGHEHRFVQLASTFPLELLGEGSLIGDGMHVYANAQALAIGRILKERGIDRLLNGWSMDVHFSGLCLPTKTLRVGPKTLPLPILAPLEAGELAAHFIGAHQTADETALHRILAGCSAQEVIASATERVQGVVDEVLACVPNVYDAVDWLELLGNSTKQGDFLNVLAMDRIVPAAIPAHDNQMVESFLKTPPGYRFNQRIYLEMYRLLDPRVRRIDYTTIGGPLSDSVLWNWARMWARKMCRDILVAGVRRLLKRPPSSRHLGAWPEAGSAMRTCPEWHTTLREHVETSRLVDMGIASGDGLRQIVAEHLGWVRNHAPLLNAWLTLEEWLAAYG